MTTRRSPYLIAAALLIAGACTQAPTAVDAPPSDVASENGLVLGSGNRSDTTSAPADTRAADGNGLVLGSGN